MGTDDSIDLKIIASPDTVADHAKNVVLTVTGTKTLPSKALAYEWECSKFSKSPFNLS